MNSVNEAEEMDVGSLLRDRREQLGWTMAEVAEKTRIRRAYLAALEENRFDALPAPAYLSGFLRSYAGALGLDPEGVLLRLRAQTDIRQGTGKEAAAPPGPETVGGPPFRSRRPHPALLLAVLIAVGLLLYGQYGRTPLLDASPAPSAPDLPAVADEKPTLTSDAVIPPSPGETVIADSKEPVAEDVAESPELPVLPAAGGMLRLEAKAPVVLEVEVDDRSPQRYDLGAESVLRWKVEHRFRITAAPPQAVLLWVEETPFTMGGRSELELPAAKMGAGGDVSR